jgi:hypothetical protein
MLNELLQRHSAINVSAAWINTNCSGGYVIIADNQDIRNFAGLCVTDALSKLFVRKVYVDTETGCSDC